MTTDPLSDHPTAPVTVARLRAWAAIVAFAIDNPPECIDALLELAEQIEEAIEAAERAP